MNENPSPSLARPRILCHESARGDGIDGIDSIDGIDLIGVSEVNDVNQVNKVNDVRTAWSFGGMWPRLLGGFRLLWIPLSRPRIDEPVRPSENSSRENHPRFCSSRRSTAP
jgi:hypothetical protein